MNKKGLKRLVKNKNKNESRKLKIDCLLDKFKKNLIENDFLDKKGFPRKDLNNTRIRDKKEYSLLEDPKMELYEIDKSFISGNFLDERILFFNAISERTILLKKKKE